jgi:hypothetical protein
MKKLFVAMLVLTGLLFLNMNIFAGPLPGITHENSIQVASKKGQKDKDAKVKKGKASRKTGQDGKASRKAGKNGKAGRG